jgi:hypothetical protein
MRYSEVIPGSAAQWTLGGVCGNNLASGDEAHLGRKSAGGYGPPLSRLPPRRQSNFRGTWCLRRKSEGPKGPFAKACRICWRRVRYAWPETAPRFVHGCACERLHSLEPSKLFGSAKPVVRGAGFARVSHRSVATAAAEFACLLVPVSA